MMMMFLRPTALLRIAKRTTAHAGTRGSAKRAAAISSAMDVSARGSSEVRAASSSSSAAAPNKTWHANGTKSLTKSNTKSNSHTAAGPVVKASAFVPDHREKLVQIFQRLAEINHALGEKYKAQSYQIAVDKLKRDDYIFLHLPPNIVPPGVDDARRSELVAMVNATPTVGDKLKVKMVEILTTGDLAELHSLQAKPIIRAIQELTQVHGFGPRTAVAFHRKYGVKTVAELQQRMREQESGKGNSNHSSSSAASRQGGSLSDGKKHGSKKSASSDLVHSPIHLTEAQRLGLKYHRDISQRILHSEGRLHEAFLKLRLRKYLGKGYELSICGSYRRRRPTSGDIDVLITRKTNGDGVARRKRSGKGRNDAEMELPPQEVLAAFVEALKQERYIEATLAQGPTKFMGMSRLKSYNYNAGGSSAKMYPARRLDIRFVEPECFPAALLYFTGSKNFNVVMRAEAIKQSFILNEYGLFRNDTTDEDGKGRRNRWNAEAFQKLVRAQYYSKSPSANAVEMDEAGEEEEANDGEAKRRAKKSTAKEELRRQQELETLWHEVEARRVKVRHERDIFAALGMTYVQPEHREV